MSHGFDDSTPAGFGPEKAPSFPPVQPPYGAPLEGTGGPPRPRRGCFFYGCITALILFLLLVVALVLLIRMGLRTFQLTRDRYTATAPAQLPVVDLPDEEREALEKRADDFKKRVTEPDSDQAEPLSEEQRTLVLTTDELNALLERSPEVRGKFYVSIEKDRLRAKVSLPLDAFPGLKGRYLNAESDVDISVQNGEPVLHLRDLRVKGMPLPPDFNKGIERVDWLDEAKTSDGTRVKTLLGRRLEKIEVKDGKLIIVARREPGGEPARAPGAAAVLEWKTEDGGNGHFYELVAQRKRWSEAAQAGSRREHDGKRGHLVTITSEAENAFLRDRVVIDEVAWIGLTDDPAHGGNDSKKQPNPARDGWVWVTGEKLDYLGWAPGEPDHGGDGPAAHFAAFDGSYGPRRGTWTDLPDDPDGGRYFVVEFEPESAPAPSKAGSSLAPAAK